MKKLLEDIRVTRARSTRNFRATEAGNGKHMAVLFCCAALCCIAWACVVSRCVVLRCAVLCCFVLYGGAL